MADKYMSEALHEAYEGINNNHGGPFGSVIVKDGVIVGRGHNRVVAENDPTLHGEICAIRDACHRLGTFDLSGCDLYTTSEPCPMCLGAVLWAGISHVYYGCDRNDAESIGFRDNVFYKIMDGTAVTSSVLDRDDCLKLFSDYSEKKDKTLY